MTRTRCKGLHEHIPCPHLFRNTPGCELTCERCVDERREQARAKREREEAVQEASKIVRRPSTPSPERRCYSCGGGPIAGDPMFNDGGGGDIHRSCAG